MVLRYVLSVSIAFGPAVEAMAQAAQNQSRASNVLKTEETFASPALTQNHDSRSTNIIGSDAPDWVIEGLAEKDRGNRARAKVLFESAKKRILVEKLPQPYRHEIMKRLDQLIASVEEDVSSGVTTGNTAANAKSAGQVSKSNNSGGTNAISRNSNANNAARKQNNKVNSKDPLVADPSDGSLDDLFSSSGDVPSNAATGNPSTDSANGFGDPINGNTNGGLVDPQSPAALAEAERLREQRHQAFLEEVMKIDPKSTFMVTKADPSVIRQVLAKNEEGRALLWWITAGRMARNAQSENLLEIIRRDLRINNTQAYDQYGYAGSGFGGGMGRVDMGGIYELLYLIMGQKNYTYEAVLLMRVFDGATLDELADRYIKQTTFLGAAVAGAFAINPSLRHVSPSISAGDQNSYEQPGMGKKALTGDILARGLVNLTATMNIAALYGVQLDGYTQQLTAMVIFTASRVAFWKLRSRPGPPKTDPDKHEATLVQQAVAKTGEYMEGLGRRMRKAKHSAKGDAAQAEKNMQDVLNSELDQMVKATKADDLDIVIPNVNLPSNTGGVEPNKNQNQSGGGKKPPKKMSPVEKVWRLAIATGSVAWSAAWGGTESYVLGQLAKHLFKGMHEADVKLKNKVFLQQIASPKGLPYLKILAHSMALGRNKIEPVQMKRGHDRHVDFILNLARAAGICSDDDYQKLNAERDRLAALKEQEKRDRAFVQLGRRSPRPLTAAEKEDLFEMKLLNFSCLLPYQNQKSEMRTYNFNMLERELLTFNAIDADAIARLRVTPLRDRIRMAQLLLQFQFLDGVRTQEEIRFFQQVQQKILGVTSAEQHNYLDRFAGYISQAGGMVPTRLSPTGFMVNPERSGIESPFDYGLAPSAPDAPSDILAVDPDDINSMSTDGFGNSGVGTGWGGVGNGGMWNIR